MTRAEKKKSGQCDRRCRRRRMCTDRMNEKSIVRQRQHRLRS